MAERKGKRRRAPRAPQQAEGSQESTPTTDTGEVTKMADDNGSKIGQEAIDPNEIPAQTRSGKASVVIDEFMESGVTAVKLTDATKGFNVALRKYVKANDLPVEVVTRAGTHYLRRSDLAAASAPAE